MVANISPEVIGEYPPELIRFAAAEAAWDADEVATLLSAAGLAPPPGDNRGLPPGILLDLAAVVRLRRWEAAGFSVHRDAGLPTARVAINNVVNTLVAAAGNLEALAAAGALGRAVFDLAVTRFAWAARPELGADVVLHANDEAALVEAMAQFLWANRHQAPATT